jgi:hypothetical protein
VAATRRELLQRWEALKQERSSWLTHWSEIATYLLPRSGRFLSTRGNDGTKKHNSIYDSTGTRSLRVLAAGMMAGMTSPARPWFRLATRDADMLEYAPVKTWLHKVTQLMRDIYARGNTYRSLHMLYEELGCYGTAATVVLPDYDDVLRHYPLTAGEYAVAVDARGEVQTLFREFELTTGQLVREFGHDKVSPSVRAAYDRGTLDQWWPVVHCIEPRDDREPAKARTDARHKAYRSVYFELGRSEYEGLLRDSGFDRFPALVPRWLVTSGDIYGASPGMEALGDIKQLQHEQLRKAQGIDYMTKPPLQVPNALMGREVDLLPGGITYVDAAQHAGIRSTWDVRLDLSHLLGDIQDVRQRIGQTFYSDLFLMLANDDRSNITAREIAERHEEKLLMLGPVLERLHDELLSPMIELTFSRLLEAGLLPPPPQELEGEDLNVEFVSMLAQAQRAVGTQAVDRLLGTVGAIAQLRPEVLDKLDADQVVDTYADMLGVDPSLIVADDKVVLVRRTRAQQERAAQMAAAAPGMAKAARDMGSIDTGSKNAYTDAIDMFSGYAGGAAGLPVAGPA